MAYSFYATENGWGPLGNTIFGSVLINGIGWYLMKRNRNKGAAM
ncbi:hypothetical protein [Paenibacillus sp. USDA918EY]|nr:hypothetical protein [Paenibacillus sp. USDA918EY]